MRTPAPALFLASLVAACSSAPPREVVHPRIATVEDYRAARARDDLEAAKLFLGPDPRVWYDAKEGSGTPLKLGGGRWKAWDDEFRSSGDPGPWTLEGDTVWAVVTEWNDYFRLVEREDPPRYRMSYFFDEEDRIVGQMVSKAPAQGDLPVNVSRFDEFRVWAEAQQAEEWAYLRPGGSLDPTGDRALRTRRLLEVWRREVNLPPLQ